MERLDNVLVKKGFFESRNKAIYEIKSNNVLVNGKMENKPSKQINIDDKIVFENAGYKCEYVNLKLNKNKIKYALYLFFKKKYNNSYVL